MRRSGNAAPERGYGNIYTPHAGSMIIHVQREGGLANRTFVLSRRQVRFFRRGMYVLGGLFTVVILSWLYLATQAARVPFLTQRLQTYQHDARRLDTLQTALDHLEGRFQQVQKMLGAGPAQSAAASKAAAGVDTAAGTIPDHWPLPIAGELLGNGDIREDATPSALDIAVPAGTQVRVAGSGVVADVANDVGGGRVVRVTHADGFVSIYSNLTDVRVIKGSRVPAGTVIGLTGGPTGSLPAHLRFEVRRGGATVNPTTLMKEGPAHGDLQQ